MVRHESKIIKRDGYTKTTTLCGRMNKANSDGMNVANSSSDVTCKFCLAIMSRAKIANK